ncbi:hypothetical protein [Streptomyces malaysiensis]|uniref:hypothetical protein n=1 Tax=Streptomyces malaysiensis TaxID=92644 RepID=UPI00321FE4CE|nr:hypothetical protein [Streptomyces malaysiensis]
MTTRRGPTRGQLALFEAQPRPRRPRRTPTHWPRRYRGRRIHDLPDIATYQET